MRCNRCGLINQDMARFCNKCGTPLNIVPSQPQPPPVQQAQKSQAGKWLLGILGGLVVLGVISSALKEKPTSAPSTSSAPSAAPTPKKPDAAIHAEVKFSGTQFVITNKDSYNWTDVTLKINSGVFAGGYELKHSSIEAGQTYTVGALQFADSDGKRFNPYQTKPQKFTICGTTPNGFTCYAAGWD